jgi:hypothetical protein
MVLMYQCWLSDPIFLRNFKQIPKKYLPAQVWLQISKSEVAGERVDW